MVGEGRVRDEMGCLVFVLGGCMCKGERIRVRIF